MTRVTYEHALKETGEVTFMLTDSENFRINPKQFMLNAPVIFGIGYGDDITYIFDGHITAIRPHFESQQASYVEIRCEDRSVELKRVPDNRAFVNLTLREIVELIASNHGLEVEFGDDKLSAFDLKDAQTVDQDGITDWEVFGDIAKLTGVEYFIVGNKLYIADDHYLGNELEYLRHTFYHLPFSGDMVAASDQPLITFAPETNGDLQRLEVNVIAWASVGTDGVVRGTKRLEELPATGDRYTELKVKFEHIETLKIRNQSIRTDAQARTLAQAELERRARELVKGQMTIPGNGLIMIGQRHDVVCNDLGVPGNTKGFGRQYSGAYTITGVRHEFGESGFLTYCDVRRAEVTRL
jgi:hypothetical protein